MTNPKETELKRRPRYACSDIFHGDDKVVLKLEMPGVSKDNLEIKVDNNILMISGKKEIPADNGKYLLKEIQTGDYYQEYTLDDTIDRNNIGASVKNGVVTLVLGLKESLKPRTIKINVV